MIKPSENEVCFKYLWTCVLLYMVEYPLLSNAILTRMIWIPALLVLAYFTVYSIRVWNATELFSVFLVALIIVFQMISSGSITSSQHWIAAFCLILQLLSVMVCSKCTINKKTYDYIFWINVGLAILFLLYSFLPIAYKVTTKGRVWSTIYFVFNLDNANIAGIYLFCIFSILLINIKYRKHKVILAALMLYVLYMIYKTNTRSCIIAAIAIVLICFFFGQRHIPKWVVAICMVFPIIFAFMYVYLFRNISGTYVIMGKNLFTGRQDIFLEYLSSLNSNWDYLFGNFGVNALQNAHNAPVSIVSSIGIIGLLVVYLVFWKSINRINKQGMALAATCIACILGIFIETSAEATMLLGGFPGIVFMNSFFLLAGFNPLEQS